jgi:hypothetical protein
LKLTSLPFGVPISKSQQKDRRPLLHQLFHIIFRKDCGYYVVNQGMNQKEWTGVNNPLFSKKVQPQYLVDGHFVFKSIATTDTA